jgi:hypothetical protein
VIERIVAPLGVRVDESSPYADARLPAGSRVQTRFLSALFLPAGRNADLAVCPASVSHVGTGYRDIVNRTEFVRRVPYAQARG